MYSFVAMLYCVTALPLDRLHGRRRGHASPWYQRGYQ